MQKCCSRYMEQSFIDAREKIVVLEIGSADVNGSYREIFSHPKIQYCGADLTKSKGVDLVLKSPYEIPLADAYADVVISGQMLEHCAYFWLSFQEMVRVLKPDGYLFLIAPSAGPIHRYPVDCYRFYPDAFKALADLAGCYLIDSWLDKRGPWKDLVGVFSKQRQPKWAENTATGRTFRQTPATREKRSWLTRPWTDVVSAFSRRQRLKWAGNTAAGQSSGETSVLGERKLSLTPSGIIDNDSELNAVSGATSYLDLLKIIHRELAPRLYLEIGVGKGTSLRFSDCVSIGIDPEAKLSHSLPIAATIYRRTSDDFFESDAQQAIRGKIDLAFIDGMHHFEYALRDFINIEHYSALTSLVVVDDIFPNHPVQARRVRESVVWTGDVWKLLACLKMFRTDLILVSVNTSPTGSLLIAGLDPASRELSERYNSIVRQFVTEADDNPPVEFLTRHSAIQPDDPRLVELLRFLRLSREECWGERMIREKLGHVARRFVESSHAVL